MKDGNCRRYGMGRKAVVVKGGHTAGNALDVLFDGTEIYHFDNTRIDTKNTRNRLHLFS